MNVKIIDRAKFVFSVLGMVFIGMGIIDFFLLKKIQLALAEYVLGMVLLIIYLILKIKTANR